MSYWKDVLPILEEKGSITCYEVQRITNTTAPHSVIKDLKDKGYIGGYEDKVGESGKTFREHYYKDTFRLNF